MQPYIPEALPLVIAASHAYVVLTLCARLPSKIKAGSIVGASSPEGALL
jgi:hypothetical protein